MPDPTSPSILNCIQTLGESVNITCHVELSIPPSTLRVELDVSSQSNIEIHNDMTSNSMISIESLVMGNVGNYYCLANNSVSAENFTITLGLTGRYSCV